MAASALTADHRSEAVRIGSGDDIVDFFRIDTVSFQDDARYVIGDRAVNIKL
jgi:hypothetical protein